MKNRLLTLIFSLFFIFFFASCDNENLNKEKLPSITTEQVFDITGETAKCGGNIDDDAGSTVVKRGVCWDTIPNPTIENNKTEDGSGGGFFESKMESLSPNIKYYVRAYATNENGTNYGMTLSFSTLSYPTVEIKKVYDITYISAKIESEIIKEGTTEIIEKGICWSEEENPTINDSFTPVTEDDFIGEINNLTANTKYYVRAYATNSIGTAYSNISSFTTNNEPSFEPDASDDAGNLLIMNNSNQQLVLYKNGIPVKNIPSQADNYIVNLPTSDGELIQLSLYNWEDVKNNVNNPPQNMAFKDWEIILANSTDANKQVKWYVSESPQNTATVQFNYYEGTDYYAEVYLNGKSGSKLLILKPGQKRKIGIDYGNYTLSYRYTKPDQSNPDIIEEIGWIERQFINEKEDSIWLILYEQRNDVTMVTPHYDGDSTTDQLKYGNIKIINNNNFPIQVYIGQNLIVNYSYITDDRYKNLSTITGMDNYTYIIPIIKENKTFQELDLKAIHLTTGEVVIEETVLIETDTTTNWTIN